MPPRDLNISVRVLKDYGTIETSVGSVVMAQGVVHLLPRTEAEPLIRQGVLEPLDLVDW